MEVLYAYWRQHPPVHELVAAYVGYKPPAAAPSEQELIAELQKVAVPLPAHMILKPQRTTIDYGRQER